MLWLLEELGLSYEIKRYARDPKTPRASPELLEVHPLGKSPVVADGDKTIAESGAIIEYFVDTYGVGRLAPAAGSPERLRHSYFMHYAVGSMTPRTVGGNWLSIDDPRPAVDPRTVTFQMPDGEMVYADERFFLVRLEAAQMLSTERWTDLEREVIAGYHWWSAEELLSTADQV